MFKIWDPWTPSQTNLKFILIKMEMPAVVEPSGNWFLVCFFVMSHVSSIWRCCNHQHDFLWRDPFRSLAIRASQLEATLMFHSNQPSSVTLRGLRSGSYPTSASRVYTKTTQTTWASRELSGVLLVFFHHTRQILTLWRHHRERRLENFTYH